MKQMGRWVLHCGWHWKWLGKKSELVAMVDVTQMEIYPVGCPQASPGKVGWIRKNNGIV